MPTYPRIYNNKPRKMVKVMWVASVVVERGEGDGFFFGRVNHHNVTRRRWGVFWSGGVQWITAVVAGFWVWPAVRKKRGEGVGEIE